MVLSLQRKHLFLVKDTFPMSELNPDTFEHGAVPDDFPEIAIEAIPEDTGPTKRLSIYAQKLNWHHSVSGSLTQTMLDMRRCMAAESLWGCFD